MGYIIRPLPWKKSCPKWNVQFVSYKKDDAYISTAKKPKKEWDVEKSKWRSLGFHSLMTLDEAKTRAKPRERSKFVRIDFYRLAPHSDFFKVRRESNRFIVLGS